MTNDDAVTRMADLLKRSRLERRISQRQLAYHAGVRPSVVNRAERGQDAKLSTWDKLFRGMGIYLLLGTTDDSEEAASLMAEEHEARLLRRLNGLYCR